MPAPRIDMQDRAPGDMGISGCADLQSGFRVRFHCVWTISSVIRYPPSSQSMISRAPG